MITTTKIYEVMTKNVVTISDTDMIVDIQRTFTINHLRHAPVCEGSTVVGMISLIDLRRNISFEEKREAASKEDFNLTARQIMAPDPITLQSNQTVKDAALIFSENEFHAAPVLENGNLVGIISTTDIIRFLINAIDEWEEDSTA